MSLIVEGSAKDAEGLAALAPERSRSLPFPFGQQVAGLGELGIEQAQRLWATMS